MADGKWQMAEEERKQVREVGLIGAAVLAGGLLLLAFGLVLSCTGCGTFGANPSAPTGLETKLFSVTTNYVPVVVPVTNFVTNVTVTATSEVVTNWTTNLQGVVQFATNVIPVNMFVTNVSQVTAAVTNLAPAYTLSTSPATAALAQGAGAAINAVLPGAGSLVSMGLLALFGGWGYLRSSKLGDTSAALAQEIETVRSFVQALPNGGTYDTALTQFLQAHQNEAGVATQVLNLLANEVSNPDAKVAAQQLINTINGLKAVTQQVPQVNAG